MLFIFWVGALPFFSLGHALNIEPETGQSPWFPKGVINGITAALPFAIWFYLAIEQLPLAAEESNDPKKDIPTALVWGHFHFDRCLCFNAFSWGRDSSRLCRFGLIK